MHKIIIFFLSLVILQINSITAQNVILNESCDGIGTGNKLDSHVQFDKTTETLYSTKVGNKKLYINSYKNFKAKESITIDRNEKLKLFYRIKETFVNNKNEFLLFYSAKKSNIFSLSVVDLTSKTIRHKPIVLTIPKVEKYLYSFKENNTYYILSYSIEKPFLTLYQFDTQSENFIAHSISLEKIKFLTKDDNSADFKSVCKNLPSYWFDFFGFSKYKGFNSTYYNDYNEHDPNILASHLKFFTSEESLYLTIDGFENTTQLLTINLIEYSATVKRFPFEESEPYYSKKQTNSIVHENQLIQISCTDEHLNLYKTEIAKAKLTILRDTIALNNNNDLPIIRRTDNEVFENNEPEFVKTKKFLKKASNHNIFIDITRINNTRARLTLGSYYILESKNQNGYTTTKTNLFFSRQNILTTNYSGIKGSTSDDYEFYKINSLKEEIYNNKNCYSVFEINGEFYFGYFIIEPIADYYDGPQKVSFAIIKP